MTNEKEIWKKLIELGFTEIAAAGIIGNLKCESALNPKNLQNSCEKRLGYNDETYTKAVDNGTYTNFVKDKAGYGLAQWTYWSRKEKLLNFAKSKNKSIGDLEMQIEYLYQELKGYKLVDKLNFCDNIQDASDIMLLKFEKPKDQSVENQKRRAAICKEFYDNNKSNCANNSNNLNNSNNTNNTSNSNQITYSNGKIDVKDYIKTLYLALNSKTLYVMGCFGAPLNDKNKARYTKNHTYNMQAVRTNMIKNATADTFGFDCVCLLKACASGWNADKSKTYGGTIVNKEGSGISYGPLRIPDASADGMIKLCKDVSTDFKNIQVGEAVWMAGHIGVYVGEGKVIESSPKWENKVQISNLGNLGYTTGHYRNWTKHGKLPFINYTISDKTEIKEQKTSSVQTMKVCTSGASLRIRKGPSLNDAVLTTMPNGSTVEIIDKSNKDWYKVSYKGFVGYSSSKYLK